MTKLANVVFLSALLSSAACAQINAGEQKSDPNLPFTITQVASFDLPWRIAFLPDGRMLVTEKVGRVDLVTQQGAKTQLRGIPASYYEGQNGMLGVFLSPHYAADHSVYLTYVEPGDYGGGLALGRGRLVLDGPRPGLQGFQVLWRQIPKGKGGQEGAQIAFSPDGKYLFLAGGQHLYLDELNLIQRGKNYGWPLVSYGVNYDGVPIPSPDTRPDLVKPVIYWVPVITPGNLMFYKGNVFPHWNGSALTSGLATEAIVRITLHGSSATAVQRWSIGKRVRDVEEAPDGTLWMLEDADSGGLFHLTPK